MDGLINCKKFIELINLLNELYSVKSFQVIKLQLLNKKKQKIKKVYMSLFDYRKLELFYSKIQYKNFIKNSLDSILEFINKSLNVNELTDNKLKVLLHLNRLVAFSFEKEFVAGLRNINQSVSDDFRNAIYNSYVIQLKWHSDLLRFNFCIEDLLKHFLYITVLQPFRSFNIQTAFAWGLVIERVCISNLYTFPVLRYLPLFAWGIESILQYNSKDTIVELISNFFEYFKDQIIRLKSNIIIPSNFFRFLNRRQVLGVLFILRTGCVSRKKYSKHFKISFMTAFRDLKYMVSKGILIKKGSNNKTLYCFNDSINFSS